MNTIFHISLALLKDSNKVILIYFFGLIRFKELLHSDFEGILKFFRVNLPRKYRTEVAARELIHAAVKLKVWFVKFDYEMKIRYLTNDCPSMRKNGMSLNDKRLSEHFIFSLK